MTYAVVDCETTGLDPDRHEIWEVALILHDTPDADGKADGDREYVWQLPVDEANADLIALNIGGYHQRRWRYLGHDEDGPANETLRGDTWGQAHGAVVRECDVYAWARQFADLTWGLHLVGSVPSFDEERLRRLLRRLGVCPGWHYHLIDVEALVVGYLAANIGNVAYPELDGGLSMPWKSDTLSRALGVEPPTGAACHTALGDARWARDLLDAVLGEQ